MRHPALDMLEAGISKSDIARRLRMSRQRVDQLAQPEKLRARQALNEKVQRGVIRRPTACQRCGKDAARIEGHHSDYQQRLKVDWLCPPCHSVEHYGPRPMGAEVKLGEYQVCKALKKNGEPCGHRWLPRGTYVYRCPSCMSFRWNEEPQPQETAR